MRRLLASAAAAVVVTGTLLAAPAPAGAGAPDTAYFDMFANPHVAPKRIFLTASSGPWLQALDWRGWGSDEAVAHGVYRSDCASCPPPRKRKATVTFTRPELCTGEGDGYYAYGRGVVELSKPDRGRTKTTFRIPMGCP
jgi:hypothetical protein